MKATSGPEPAKTAEPVRHVHTVRSTLTSHHTDTSELVIRTETEPLPTVGRADRRGRFWRRVYRDETWELVYLVSVVLVVMTPLAVPGVWVVWQACDLLWGQR